MPAPTLDKIPGPPGSVPARPRRRARVLLVATALVVLASAIGVSAALAGRPMGHQAPPQEGFTAAGSTPGQTPSPSGQAPTEPQPTQDSTASAPVDKAKAAKAPALPDGHHDAYITKVGNDSIVVDLVQVFEDDEAVEAAIEDGESGENARYRTTYVRNQNRRLRTLPLAGDLRIELRDACGDPGPDQDALLTKLAANARLGGTYYYTLTVSDGAVERIRERLAVNAC